MSFSFFELCEPKRIILALVLTVARFVEHKLSEGAMGPEGALTTARDQLLFLENGLAIDLTIFRVHIM